MLSMTQWSFLFQLNCGRTKYLTYMPTQEELRREIEQQKEFYKLQNKQ